MRGDLFKTAWGWMAAAHSDCGLSRLVLPRQGGPEAWRALHGPSELDTHPWPELRRQVRAYFAGDLRVFTLPLDLDPPGSFTASVWEVVKGIPFGGTVSYGEVARRIGRGKSARAVGRAMACNPVPLCIPCHRVVGSRDIGGFSGGLSKVRLLLHESRNTPGLTAEKARKAKGEAIEE